MNRYNVARFSANQHFVIYWCIDLAVIKSAALPMRARQNTKCANVISHALHIPEIHHTYWPDIHVRWDGSETIPVPYDRLVELFRIIHGRITG